MIKITRPLVALPILGCLVFVTHTVNANEITDMCPAIPAEILAAKPKRKDFVFTKIGEPGWKEQNQKYQTAKSDYDKRFAKATDKVEAQWVKLESTQFASQTRFYGILSQHIKDESRLEQIKAGCWREVMGIDEFEKDNLCNPLQKKPKQKHWNKILACTLKRTKDGSVEIHE